jgi:hypothetical protein
MAKKHTGNYRHPLDQFVANDNDWTMLGALTTQFAEKPFDDKAKYRDELVSVLKQREYRHKVGSKVILKTFHELLQGAGLLEKLLADDTLQEFWKSQLLDRILKRANELQLNRLAVDGQPLTKHRRTERAIQQDLETIEKLTEKYGLKDMGQNIELIAGEAVKAWRPLNQSRKPGSTRALLIGREATQKRLNREETAIQVIIYRTLKARLDQTTWKKKNIPDIFMCKLAELIWLLPSSPRLSSGETLRRADRDMPGW